VPSLVRESRSAQVPITMDTVEMVIAKALIRVARIRANLEIVTLVALLRSKVLRRMAPRLIVKLNHQAKVILMVLMLIPMEVRNKSILNRNSNRRLPTKSIIKHTVLIQPMAILLNLVPHKEVMLIRMLVIIHIKE
jgi:hypothetical protein